MSWTILWFVCWSILLMHSYGLPLLIGAGLAVFIALATREKPGE